MKLCLVVCVAVAVLEVTVTVVGVAVTGVGGDGPESLFTKAGSTWQPDYSQNKLLALIIKDYHSHNHNTSPLNHISSLHNHTSSLHNPTSSLHEHSTSLHNHPTSNHNQGIFFSIVNRNGNIHKLLEEFVGTSVLDKVTQYFFNKLGVSESRSFGSTSVVRNSFSKDHVSQHSTYNQPHTAQDSAYHQLHTAEDSAYHQPYSTEDSAYHQPHTAEDSAYHQPHTAEDSAYHQPHTAEDSAYHQPHTAEDSAYHQRDNNWHYGSGVATYVEDFDTRSSSYADVDEYHEMPVKGACINMHNSYYTGLTCIDLYSALSIAALAVLLQFIYYFSVALLCPNAGNRKLVFNITNDNFVKVSSVQGSQTQLQNQSQNENQNQKQEEHQDQHQAQMESQTQSQAQSQTESQFQGQSQTVSVTVARGFRSLRQTGSHSVRNEADEFYQELLLALSDVGIHEHRDLIQPKSKYISQRHRSLDKKIKMRKLDQHVPQNSDSLENSEEWSEWPRREEKKGSFMKSSSNLSNFKDLFTPFLDWNEFSFPSLNWPNFDIPLGKWITMSLPSISVGDERLLHSFCKFLIG